jgi:hypothetical protein
VIQIRRIVYALLAISIAVSAISIASVDAGSEPSSEEAPIDAYVTHETPDCGNQTPVYNKSENYVSCVTATPEPGGRS